jgi:hypothetical protein
VARVIVEVFGRAFIFQFAQGKVHVQESESDEFEHAPVDPHSVGGCMVEHADQGSVEVQELSGAGVYAMPQERKVGFGVHDVVRFPDDGRQD